MGPFQKIVYLGDLKARRGRNPVFCKIEFKDDHLSVTGVIAPTRNGDCESCGQIEMSLQLDNFVSFAPGWNADLVAQFLETWRHWHLNDLRAGCEHQRAAGWKLCPGHYPSDEDKKSAVRPTCSGAMEPWASHLFDEATIAKAKTMLEAAGYNVYKAQRERYHCREDKLSQPCPVCGYKMGTAWLFEAVPEDVLTFLSHLPDTTVTPAWV